MAILGTRLGATPGRRPRATSLDVVDGGMVARQRVAPVQKPRGPCHACATGHRLGHIAPRCAGMAARLASDAGWHARAIAPVAHLHWHVRRVACRHRDPRARQCCARSKSAPNSPGLDADGWLDMESFHGKPLAACAGSSTGLGYKRGPLGPFERRLCRRRIHSDHFCYQLAAPSEKNDTEATYTHLSARENPWELPRRPPDHAQ